MKKEVRWRPLEESKRIAARKELGPFHQDLLELYGEDWAYHSDYARIINEVARGLYPAAEAIRLSKEAKKKVA
ncbi:MAG TPA: hypothetical protein VN665_03880 [Candidatus Paceibacterota bacterium]|nr:hypothetical protein [Candidatus Paceibacterota bacterium]